MSNMTFGVKRNSVFREIHPFNKHTKGVLRIGCDIYKHIRVIEYYIAYTSIREKGYS